MENLDTQGVIERLDSVERAIFDTTKAAVQALPKPDEVSPAAATEIAWCVGRMLAVLASVDQPEKYFAEVLTQVDGPMGEDGKYAQVVGHLVMQAFGEDIGLGATRKMTLIEIGEVLGPDNLESLRKQVAFMIKVDEFH